MLEETTLLVKVGQNNHVCTTMHGCIKATDSRLYPIHDAYYMMLTNNAFYKRCPFLSVHNSRFHCILLFPLIYPGACMQESVLLQYMNHHRGISTLVLLFIKRKVAVLMIMPLWTEPRRHTVVVFVCVCVTLFHQFLNER